MALREFGLLIPCPTEQPTYPAYGTYMGSSCDPDNGGFFTTHNYYADGNGGEYTEDTGIGCGY